MSDYVYTVEELKMSMLSIFVNYGIKKAVLFGSYSKGYAEKVLAYGWMINFRT